MSAALRYQSSCLSLVSPSMASGPAARAASAASFRAGQRVDGLQAHVLPRSVPVSVTARISPGTRAPHSAWPATLPKASNEASRRRGRRYWRKNSATPWRPSSRPCLCLACTVNSANFPAEAEWTQASFPAARNPVSSKCSTSAGDQIPGDRGQRGREEPRRSSARRRRARRARIDYMSDSAGHRSPDRNCPCDRETPVPILRGPGMGPARPRRPGPGPSSVNCIAHFTVSSCVLGPVDRFHRRDVDDPARRSTAVTGAFFMDFPQQEHFACRCRNFWSGSSDSSIVAPGWPFGRPGLRPDLPRRDFGDGLASLCDDGGLELREFASTWATRSATCDCSSARGLTEHRVLGGLLPDPGIPLGQQPCSRAVRSAKAAITAAGNARHLGHGRTLPRLRPARK